MNIKKIMLSSLLMLGFLSASAQDQEKKVLRTDYIFEPHWYVQLQPIGGQYTLGEVDFQHLLSWNVQAALGYNFNPYLGARLAVNAWQSKGGIDAFETAQTPKRIGWKWNYVAPNVDLTLNLSNVIMGNYNPNRCFNLIGFVGLGANIGWGNDEANDLYNNNYAAAVAAGVYQPGFEPFRYLWDGTKVNLNFQFGLIGDIRINDRWAISLEAQANTLSDRYNSKKAGNADWYFNALAGVKINLGNTYHAEPVYEPDPVYKEKIVYKDKIITVKEPCPDDGDDVIEPLRRDIFFTINKYNIKAGEEQKITDVVNYLNEHPTAKVTVTGYADKGTGTAAINKRLGLNRSKVVVDTLVKRGIDRSRIIADSKGDTEQPFAENDKNRVTICIAQ